MAKLIKLTRYRDGWKYEFDDGSKVYRYDNGDVKIVLADGSTKYISEEELLDMMVEDNEMNNDGGKVYEGEKVCKNQYWLGVVENLKLDGEYYVVNKSGDVVATVKGKILTVLKGD